MNKMDPLHFAYWLKGYVELNGTAPTMEQWQIIVDHLEKVFDKQTPNRDNGVQQEGPNVASPALPPNFPKIDWSKVGGGSPGLGPVIC